MGMSQTKVAPWWFALKLTLNGSLKQRHARGIIKALLPCSGVAIHGILYAVALLASA